VTLSDATARAVIQHFVVHDGEVGDIVWPLPQARLAVDLWLDAAGGAVGVRQVTAGEAAATHWQVFDTTIGDVRPGFVTVEGIDPTSSELIAALAAAAAGDAQPVLLLDSQPDRAMAAELRDAGWRLTDARELLPDARAHHSTPTAATGEQRGATR